jgi:hypothetical protein
MRAKYRDASEALHSEEVLSEKFAGFERMNARDTSATILPMPQPFGIHSQKERMAFWQPHSSFLLLLDALDRRARKKGYHILRRLPPPMIPILFFSKGLVVAIFRVSSFLFIKKIISPLGPTIGCGDPVLQDRTF